MDSNFDPAIFRDDAFYLNGRWIPFISGGSDQGDGGSQSDTGSDGGDGTGTDNPDDKGDEGKTAPTGKTFTQDEVNALIARETSKAARGKLDPKELGYESGKELKEFLDNAKKQTEEAKGETEKAIDLAKEEAVSTARREILDKANTRLVAAEFKVAAKDAGVIALDDALVIAQRMEIWKQVNIEEDDDDVKIEGFDKAFFEALKSEKPFLFAQATGAGDAGAGAGGGKGSDDKFSPERLAATYPSLAGAARLAKSHEST